ncbi:hypothetical protein [Tranquillimonas alkanivorans]|uniref:hypothetical protein n=1 Tax=Tranquillimonas alkanivorans TaxID=441119 RepID=UPI000B8879EF|nr:hypothetical protein [Tranquillimonas alkanivorans]
MHPKGSSAGDEAGRADGANRTLETSELRRLVALACTRVEETGRSALVIASEADRLAHDLTLTPVYRAEQLQRAVQARLACFSAARAGERLDNLLERSADKARVDLPSEDLPTSRLSCLTRPVAPAQSRDEPATSSTDCWTLRITTPSSGATKQPDRIL